MDPDKVGSGNFGSPGYGSESDGKPEFKKLIFNFKGHKMLTFGNEIAIRKCILCSTLKTSK